MDNFLTRIAAARASSPQQRDRQTQALASLDLNTVGAQGLTPLQLAATCGHGEILRILLDRHLQDPNFPVVEPDVTDSRQQTALHFAAGSLWRRQCTQCVAELLARGADPFTTSNDGCTPLDSARQANCPPCVRAIEERVHIWQGWVDHDEKQLLVIPHWKTKWLVVLRHRRPNFGPAIMSLTTMKCFNCSATSRLPAHARAIQCSRCGTENSVAVSLQLALYEPAGPAGPNTLPAAPSIVHSVPQEPTQLIVKTLDDPSISSASGHLFSGKWRRALQSTVQSERRYGMSVKILDAKGVLLAEHSLRLETSSDRDRLLHVLQNPVRAAYEAASSAPRLNRGGGASVAREWSCGRCTFAHEGGDAERDTCAMCGAPSPVQQVPPPPPPPPPTTTSAFPVAEPLPVPSAPPQEAVLTSYVADATAAGTDEEDEKMCVVCMERMADAAVVPCGHMCGCLTCLQALQVAGNAQCPMCRGPMTAAMRIFRN